MSEPSSSAPNATTPPKPEVSPTRNLIGLIVLVVVLVVGGMQVMAVFGYNSAVRRLNDRTADETKDQVTEEEAEALMGKKPDGEGTKVEGAGFTFLKKTYRWGGPIKSYSVFAYYTTSKAGTVLHHFETDQEKFVAEKPPATPTTPPPAKAAGGPPRTKKSAAGKKAAEKKSAQQSPGPPEGYMKAMAKTPAARPDDEKAPTPKADEKTPAPRADEKAPAAKPEEKAPAPKADEKAPAAKPEDKKADDKAK
ncbi:MAG: hypothetical protein ACYC61_08870 [Isosphaeraceae bacterium]